MKRGEVEQDQFPIGTLVYYGPDNRTVTKIVAGVLIAKDADMRLRKWFGEGIEQDPAVIAEIGTYFKSQGVKKVVMTGSIAGCPHEEGLDYPIGIECPYCPFWSTNNQPKSID